MLKQFRDWVRSGEKSPDDLLRLCLDRIAEREPEIRAWVEIGPQPPLGEGDLSGVPFGVKDIFETRGISTEYGSPLYAGRKGDRDAALVTDLRRRGAVMLGKTQTTAFAYFDPAPTRNPRDLARSPGGSSSGSAAAVAAGMVPFALGSQTQGSVIRPASYCEVTGFKPTYGRVPTDGVLPFAPSLDTVGYFTETPEDMQILWGAPTAEPARRTAPAPPPEVPALLPDVRIVNDYEGARTHEARWREHGDGIGRKLAELVHRGLAIPHDRYLEALDRIAAARTFMRAFFEEYDVVLSPATTGPPPFGLTSTGDPSANSPWTALGVPVICVPRAGGVGLQIAAGWDREPMLLATAIQYYANESKFRLQ